MNKPKIMVVENNSDILFAFKSLLEKENCIYIDTSGGKSAIEIFLKEKPNAVFLDISLDESNGLQIFKQLYQADSRIPVIIITSHNNREIVRDAIQQGAFNFLEKPLSISHIRSMIDQIKSLSGDLPN